MSSLPLPIFFMNYHVCYFSVTTGSSTSSSGVEEEGFLSSTKLYIVIAGIAALVLIAIVQATCTIYKMSKKSSVQKVSTKKYNFNLLMSSGAMRAS